MPLRKRLDDLLVSLTGLHAQALRDYIDDALAECREECAKIAEQEIGSYDSGAANYACERVAALIRGEDQ